MTASAKLLLLLAVLVPACSADGQDTAAAPTPAATACDVVEVPAHEAVEVMVTGLDCETARPVVMAADGQGRAAYEANGFACTPTDAPEGDTSYVCIGDSGQRVTFLYGTA